MVRTNSRPKHRETGPEPPTILHLVLISLLPSLPNKPFPGASLLVAAAAILSPIHPRLVAASLLATNNPHLGRISGLLHQQPPFTQDVIASLWRLPILLNTPRYGQSVLHHIHSRTSFGVYLSFEHLFFHPTQITLSFASASVSVVSFISFSPSITWRLGCLQPITPLFVYPVACSCCYPLSSSPTTSKKQIPISTFSQSLWSFIHCPHPNSLCV